MHSLNELLKKKQALGLDSRMPGGLEKIKKKLTSDLFLTHYNPDLDIMVASIAYLYGVGACIQHKMTDGTIKPIAHALRALLPAEKNYSQIEKEALGIIFSVSKSYRFIHGRHFTLQTDHKPLFTIFGPKVCLLTQPRLQRWGTIMNCTPSMSTKFLLRYKTTVSKLMKKIKYLGHIID